jgi:MATE family multidrug resistance protein
MLSLFIWFDAIHGVQSGNVRALGQQMKASIVTLVSYYGLGMPLAWHFGFGLEMGIKGFWLGFFLALILLDIGVAWVVIRASWLRREDTP